MTAEPIGSIGMPARWPGPDPHGQRLANPAYGLTSDGTRRPVADSSTEPVPGNPFATRLPIGEITP